MFSAIYQIINNLMLIQVAKFLYQFIIIYQCDLLNR